MNLIRWAEFQWDLAALPPYEAKLPARLHLEVVGLQDAKTVENVMHRSLAGETEWSVNLNARQSLVTEAIQVFVPKGEVTMLAIKDGARIIGAVLVSERTETFEPLVAGVCVLVEYRCRGFGTALLYAALAYLKEKGATTAKITTRSNLPSSKYLYPKFNSKRNDRASYVEAATQV